MPDTAGTTFGYGRLGCSLGFLALFLGLVSPGVACGGSGQTAPAGSGGSNGTGSGGSIGSGGSVAATGGASGSGTGGGGAVTGGASGTCATPPAASTLVGWAAVASGTTTTTTGGDGGPVVSVTTMDALNAAARGMTAAVVQVSGQLTGSAVIGSNKTIVGVCGGSIKGRLTVNGSANVIVRNLTIVGNNCADSPDDCSAGADAVTIEGGAHHVWFDHDDISDGSDGNLDITTASDYVTVSWTKFHYSGRRTDPAGASGGHQFSNLIGSSDNSTGDTNHLKVTFHHDWWADNVYERMPRVRFGQVHLFNNLNTAASNLYCVGVGVNANIRTESNVFMGVTNPIDSTDYSNAASIVQSIDNLYPMSTGSTADLRGPAFTPPYAYTPDPVASVPALVMAGVGPQ